jgi:predicted transcriptional regulator
MEKPWAKQPRREVPDAELAVLKVLWDRGTATIREITDVLYPRGETAHYATVQKLLERLAARRCVDRRRDGRVHRYSPTVERDDLIRDRLHEAADKLCEGSLTPLLTQLVDGRRLAPEEIEALRDLVRRLDERESP